MKPYRSIIDCGLVAVAFTMSAAACASDHLVREEVPPRLHDQHPESHAGPANQHLRDAKKEGAAADQTGAGSTPNQAGGRTELPAPSLALAQEDQNIRRAAQHEHADSIFQDERSRFIPTEYPEPFGFSLTKSWFEPWPHSHFSRRGTPFTHLFFTEPAFLDRDLFFDTHFVRGEEENEFEIEVELEWALTRRIGLVVEGPYRFLDPDAGDREEGFGDFAIAPRFLMVDTDRFLLSSNLEVEIPTGSERKGTGRGEMALSPTLSWWYDLGNWVAWSGQVGTEHGLESGDDELVYKMALTYSLLGPALFEERHDEHDHGGRHFPPGMINFITEFTGRSGLSGDERGRGTGEFLFGTSYLITSDWEARVAVQFPLFKPREFDNAYIFGLIYHF